MLKGYEALELSTQMIIKEAMRRGIEIEVLDWEDNFIRLKKAGRIEYLKQATRTSLDTYISSLIMENKEVTKLILRERGLSVPDGVTISNGDEYKEKFLRFWGKDIVIKPKSTNFGQGVVILIISQKWLQSYTCVSPMRFHNSSMGSQNSSTLCLA